MAKNDLTESNMIYHPGIVLSHWKWYLRWFALICHSLSWGSFIANCKVIAIIQLSDRFQTGANNLAQADHQYSVQSGDSLCLSTCILAPVDRDRPALLWWIKHDQTWWKHAARHWGLLNIYICVFFMVDPLDRSMAHERHMKGIEQINHDTPCESEILVKSLQLTL